MSFDLDVLRGSIDMPESEREPLDAERLLAQLRALPGVEDEGDELFWTLPAAQVTFLALESDGAVRTLGVELSLRGDPSDDELRTDYARLLDVLERIASTQGARIWDGQLGRYLDDVGRDEAVGSLLGGS
jgi:hypothetical protein